MDRTEAERPALSHPAMRKNNLQITLRRVYQRELKVSRMAFACRSLLGFIGLIWLLVLLDAVLAFDTPGLIFLDLLVLGYVAAMACRWLRRGPRYGFDPRRTARHVEQQLGLSDNRFINAVDLATGVRAGTLADAIVCAGDEAAAEIESRVRPNPRPLHVGLRNMLLALFVSVGVCFLLPQLMGWVLPRLLNPFADLPPFTLLRFEVSAEPDRIYAGQPAAIRAGISGPVIPQEAEVVLEGGAGPTSVAMLRESEGLFVLPIERASKSSWFHIRTPSGRSHRYELRVMPTPIFERVEVEYEYPRYTNRPNHREELTPRGLVAIAGSRAAIEIRSNVALSRGMFSFTPDEGASGGTFVELEPSASDASVVRGRIPLDRSGTFTLDLISSDGQGSEWPLSGRVSVLRDESPIVQMQSPDMHVLAPQGWSLPLEFAISDDVGVQAASLHLSLNGVEMEPLPLGLDRIEPTYAEARSTLSLSTLGARPGDRIEGYVEAVDTRPENPGKSRSPSFEIRVISPEQHARWSGQELTLDGLVSELDAQQAGRSGEAAGDEPGDREGGAGQARSRATRPTVLGPHASDEARDWQQEKENGEQKAPGALDPSSAQSRNTIERLEPPEAGAARRSAHAVHGVPLQYRKLVENYFRRLAEDSR